jgi:hypothetical protein
VSQRKPKDNQEQAMQLTEVPTGNAEPELLTDAEHRAYWGDGSRVTSEECATLDGADVLRDVIARNGLTALDSRAGVEVR